MLDPPRVLSDDHRGELLHRILRAALADPGNTLVRLNRNHVTALVENRSSRGVVVVADTGDSHLWDFRPCAGPLSQKCAGGEGG